MPFGITWPQYLKMWATCVVGFACGSQLIHSQYKPLDNFDLIVQQEVERIREERGLQAPSFEKKFEKVAELDKLYAQLFKVKLEKNESD